MSFIEFPKLGLDFSIPRSISVFGFEIAWYAVFICVGMLLAILYGLSRMKEFGLDEDRAMDAIIVGVIGAIVGARLYYVAFTWEDYKDNLSEIFNIRNGGLAIYGGVIGALALGLLVCKLRKVKMLPMLDITMTGFLLGQGIGRWGNFINGEAFGSETSLPWGMTIWGVAENPVHPCFLYESLWCLLGFVLFHFYIKHRKFDGEVALFYCMWYGTERMLVEGLRQDSLYFGNLRVSQILSAALVLSALVIWIVVRSKIKRENDPNYLPLYVNTAESKELLRQAEERLQKGKKSSKKFKEKDEESLLDENLNEEESDMEEEEFIDEEPSDEIDK